MHLRCISATKDCISSNVRRFVLVDSSIKSKEKKKVSKYILPVFMGASPPVLVGTHPNNRWAYYDVFLLNHTYAVLNQTHIIK